MYEEGKLGFYCCKIEVEDIAGRRSKEGLLDHLQTLEGRETQAKVKGSLGSPKSAHMCGGNSFCKGRKFQTLVGL